MNCGFQTDAFQQNAFQMCVPVVPVVPSGADSFGGSSWDARFQPESRRIQEPVDDEDGLILAYWYLMN